MRQIKAALRFFAFATFSVEIGATARVVQGGRLRGIARVGVCCSLIRRVLILNRGPRRVCNGAMVFVQRITILCNGIHAERRSSSVHSGFGGSCSIAPVQLMTAVASTSMRRSGSANAATPMPVSGDSGAAIPSLVDARVTPSANLPILSGVQSTK